MNVRVTDDALSFSNWHISYDKNECQIEEISSGIAATYLLFYLEICPKSQRETPKIFVSISGITKHFGCYVGQLLVPKPDAVVNEAGV
jgi:hypothetical protein